MKYICQKCDCPVISTDYMSEKDGYMISHGGWFYCKNCNEYTQKIRVSN